MICSVCKIDKTPNEFNKSAKNSSGLHSYCRQCHKNHYRKNAVRHKENVVKNNTQYRASVIEFLREYYQTHPCVICGEDDILVLEFDHLGDKFLSVGEMVGRKFSVSKIKEEIEKCQVLCANCHRRKTAIQQNSWRLDKKD